jgi:hypothetical protein
VMTGRASSTHFYLQFNVRYNIFRKREEGD